MITLETIERHAREREEIAEHIEKIARTIAGSSVPEKALFDSWELWGTISLTGPHVSAVFEESWQGGSEKYHVSIPLNMFGED